MGLNDAAEQLAVCHEVNVANEARIAELERDLEALSDAREKIRGVDILERQIAELEHENARLESALGDRMRTDAHGTAALVADLVDVRGRLARVFALVDPLRDDPAPITPSLVRRILDETTAEPLGLRGIFLDGDTALPIAAALRILAATIRNLPAIPPDTLDALADRLQEAP